MPSTHNRDVYLVKTLAASAARTATGTGSEVRTSSETRAIIATLDVTAAATAAGDKLDVYIQTIVDGTNWVDVIHFTQVLGNGGTKRYVDKIGQAQGQNAFEASASLAAGSARDLFGDAWRCRWDVVDTGAASFTFSVTILPT